MITSVTFRQVLTSFNLCGIPHTLVLAKKWSNAASSRPGKIVLVLVQTQDLVLDPGRQVLVHWDHSDHCPQVAASALILHKIDSLCWTMTLKITNNYPKIVLAIIYHSQGRLQSS